MIPIRDDAPRFSTPYITYVLLALNIVVFLFELTFAGPQRNALMFEFGFLPVKITALFSGVDTVLLQGGVMVPVTAQTALVPVFTSIFMHASWLHLIFNMWALWIFGDNIEDYLGHFWYLVFYLMSGLAAAALHTILNPVSAIPSVGASGAIAGIMGAYIVLYPTAQVTTLLPIFVFFTFIHLPAWLVLGYWFIVQFLSGTATSIAYSNQTSGGGVAFWAHVGGFVAGIALIKLFPRRPRRYHFVSW
ncbi:MAG TPA: rhomboid family intramembrane serine protease [Terriglobales bacterium]|nr:rhomboid family intramembrane serine protease [Terriglobales bacterium]